MEDKRVPHPKTKNGMNAKQAYEAILAIRNQSATDSNSTTDQERLFVLCEQAIADMDAVFVAAGSHPPPPPPRVR